MATTGSKQHGFGSMWHLALRFAASLAPAGPRQQSQQWALTHLSADEGRLFTQMSGPDRRHAIGVARRALGDGAEPVLVPAALLHDVGKLEAGLGTFGRVWATLAALAIGRDGVVGWETLPAGSPFSGRRRKMARYLQHDRLGAELLERAGSDDLTVAWAREHHLPPQRWTVEHHLGEILKEADGD